MKAFWSGYEDAAVWSQYVTLESKANMFFVCCYIPSKVSGEAAFPGISRTVSQFPCHFPSASLIQTSRYFIGGGGVKQGLVFCCCFVCFFVLFFCAVCKKTQL